MSSTRKRIEVLDAALADQIAAGEVVERPASALKELIDNAIDAGASRIDIELLEGGKQMICVRDNGQGIHPDDLPLCLLRHATSKIRNADELLSLQTLGFRGEALASLAAVARIEIRSRRPDDPLGCELVSYPGKAPQIERMGMPVGTRVEVSQLFAQIPARLKFLRAQATESAHCLDAVLSVALLHPEIAFYLHQSNKLVLEMPAGDQLSRVQQVLARRVPGPLVAFEDEHEGVGVRGWLAPLDQATRSRSGMYFAVRGRVIRDRQMARILREALAFGLPAQRNPVGLLILEPPDQEVDVNVHPQKCEVRFSDAARVYFALRSVLHRFVQAQRDALCHRPTAPAAGQGLRQAALLSKIQAQEGAAVRAPSDGAATRSPLAGGHSERGALPVRRGGSPSPETTYPTAEGAGGRAYRLSTRASTADYSRVKRDLRDRADAMRAPASELARLAERRQAPQGSFGWGASVRAKVEQGSATLEPASDPGAAPERASAARPGETEPALELLTVLPGPVALCRDGDRLLVADLVQVRAHMILARLTQQWNRKGALDAQSLLVPVMLRPGAGDLAAYLEHRETLARLGFEVEPFGEGAIRVRSLPAVLGNLDDPQEIEGQLLKVRPWLRLLATKSAAADALKGMAQAPVQDPAPRLARRWLSQLRQDGALDEVPGIVRWDGVELLQK